MKPGMIIYREELMMLLMMDDQSRGEAISLLARRFLRGIEPTTTNQKVDDFLAMAIPKMDKDLAEYEAKVRAGQAGGKQSASKRQADSKQTASTDEAEPKQKPSTGQQNKEQGTLEQGTRNFERGSGRAFRPPTVQEVAEYCQSRGNGISAERFVDHYSANGWKVGKSPMKDWKAAVRNWEKNEYRDNKPEVSSHNWDYNVLQAIAERQSL